MTPRLYKLALTTHITVSVGWLGAVAGFLALALAGLTSQEAQMVRAAYLSMGLTAWFVIVPLSLASLPSGLALSLGTRWGVFQHYWVLVKLFITVLATIMLLVHLRPIGHLAAVVAETTLARGELAGLRLQLVANAGTALVALLAATALSIYKPWGRTRYGMRKLREQRVALQPAPTPRQGSGRERKGAHRGLGLLSSSVPETDPLDGTPSRKVPWSIYVLLGVIVLVVLLVAIHLAGGGLWGH